MSRPSPRTCPFMAASPWALVAPAAARQDVEDRHALLHNTTPGADPAGGGVMRFSAEASFAASGVLLLSGAYCLRTVLPRRPACAPLALIPVIFGAQQAAEGLVWVGVAREDPGLVQRAAVAYLCVAVCFWPFWIPF